MSEIPQMFQRILVATDFSPHSVAALEQAVWLARQTGGKLSLTHTITDLRSAMFETTFKAREELVYGDGDVIQREIRQISDTRMRRMIAELNAPDLDIAFETTLGTAFVAVIHGVQRDGYDLVVAGTRGQSTWSQYFVGSTSKKLIRKCPCSVWIVKAEHLCPPRVILAPTDFSDVSRKAVLQGMWLAEKAKADFHVVHVVDSNDIPKDILDIKPPSDTFNHGVIKEANRRFDEFIASLGADQSQIKRRLGWGAPWQEIGRMAQELKADVITMGTVGRSGIKGLLLGNTAEMVLNTCDCSILAVKPDGFVSPIDPPFRPLPLGSESKAD